MQKSTGFILILSSLLLVGCGNNGSGESISSSSKTTSCDEEISENDSELLDECKNSENSSESN